MFRHDVQASRKTRRWQPQAVSTAPSQKSSAVPERQARKNFADLRFSRAPARHSVPKDDAGTFSETLAKFYQSTQCNISEANNLHSSIKLATLGGPSIRPPCCAVAKPNERVQLEDIEHGTVYFQYSAVHGFWPVEESTKLADEPTGSDEMAKGGCSFAWNISVTKSPVLTGAQRRARPNMALSQH